MSDEKPDPLSDVIKGLGLIFRAAKTTVERMPKKGLEDAVLETAREVGRAIENVAGAVEREVRSRKGAPGAEPRDNHKDNDRDRDKDAASPKEGAGEKPGDPPPPKPPGDP